MPPRKREHAGSPPSTIVLDNVRLLFRNFSGMPGPFNDEGERNFCVALPDDVAKSMEEDGFNVRWLTPREEGDPSQAILKIRVKYEKRDGTPTRPPLVVMISQKPDGSLAKTTLSKEMLPILDWAEIINVDLSFNPFTYSAAGRSGLSAYLKSIFVTIRVDELEARYMDVPDSAQSAFLSED